MFADAKELLGYIKKEDIEFIDIRFADLSGRWQHFTVPKNSFGPDDFENGLGFDGSSIEGFESIADADLLLFPDPGTAFVDAFTNDKTLAVIANIGDLAGRAYSKDPRRVATQAEAELKASGVADVFYVGPEAEFFIFDGVAWKTEPYSFGFSFEAADAHNDKESMSDGYWIKNKGGYFPVPPSDKFQDIRGKMVRNLEAADIQVEKHHHEVATAGQSEIDIRFDSLLAMADKLMKFKYILRNTAVAEGKTVTFMPKPIYGDNGSGMHVHMSLWKGGESQMYKEDGACGLSDMALSFISGIFEHAAALTAITNPTVNSYRRLVRGFEAPVNLAVSESNRSAIARVPGYAASPKAKHFEYRGPDATANPYLAFSALLMAGLDGVKRKLEAPMVTDKDLFSLPPEELSKLRQLPESLGEALDALDADRAFLLAGGVFTDDLIDSYSALKRDELSAVMQHPNPMEFDLYFDL